MSNTIYGINGPVVTLLGETGLSMMETVLVGKDRLVGEVIGINDRQTTVQVYENTTGLHAGEPVHTTGGPLCATLGPGILTNIFDGIERPLKAIAAQSGDFISRGVSVSALDEDKTWDVTVTVKLATASPAAPSTRPVPKPRLSSINAWCRPPCPARWWK